MKHLKTFQLFESNFDSGIQYIPTKVNGHYRIYVTTQTNSNPTDAQEVFGEGLYWKDYSSQKECLDAIEDIKLSQSRIEEDFNY